LKARKPSSVNAAGERSSQAQNEVSGRPAAYCDPRKTFGERQQFVEPDTRDLEAGAGRNAA